MDRKNETLVDFEDRKNIDDGVYLLGDSEYTYKNGNIIKARTKLKNGDWIESALYYYNDPVAHAGISEDIQDGKATKL